MISDVDRLPVLLVDPIEELEVEFATRRLNCNRIDVWQSLADDSVRDIDFVVAVAENEVVLIVLANEFVSFGIQLLRDHREEIAFISVGVRRLPLPPFRFHQRSPQGVICSKLIHPPFRVRDQMGMSVQK